MHWKVKAALQTAIAGLPAPVSYAAYYRMQRLVGGLRTTNPVEHLIAGVTTWRRIVKERRDPTDRVFFEVGTGRVPTVPLAFWLMGARRTITVDVNPYMKSELVRETIEYIAAHERDVVDLFGELLARDRLKQLLAFCRAGAFSLKRLLNLCCIDYVEPGDASRTGLPPGSIDFHTSYTVFEHIEPEVLVQILEEGNRIIRDGGLFVHMVDYSDHFSHSDATISAINFLQYSDVEWAQFAGNRYMYMNRLRHDDVLALFQSAGHRILATAPGLDARSLELLQTGRLCVNERFATKSRDILAIRQSWVVSEKAASPSRRWEAALSIRSDRGRRSRAGLLNESTSEESSSGCE